MASRTRTKDFFTLASEIAEQGDAHPLVQSRAGTDEPPLLLRGDNSTDAYMMVAGSPSSGKSSLLMKYLNPKKDEVPEPTVAMEYRFARHSGGAGGKDVAHIWEIGGGTTLVDLLSVPITPQRLPTASAVLVLDLSQPHSVVDTAATWLKATLTRASDCMDKLKARDMASHDAIVAATNARLAGANAGAAAAAGAGGAAHPDLHDMTPLPCPLLVLGAKYDVLASHDAAKRKPVLNALRYLAHVYGGAFMAVSSKDKASMTNVKGWFNKVLFGASPSHCTPDLDPSHAVLAPEGADSFADIGKPPGSTTPPPPSAVDASVAAWKAAVAALWPAPDLGAAEREIDVEAAVADHPEPAVDAARATKQEELERYRRDAERRLRQEAKAAQKRSKGSSGGPKRSKK